ncbi:MAG: glycosyltransferase family 4 protein [Nanobdellota archaeon]
MKDDKKPKLLIASDCFYPRWDGIAVFLKNIIPVVKKHFKITLVVPDRGDIQVKGVEIKKIPVSKISAGGFDFPKLRIKEIQSLIEESDLVWVHTLATIGQTAIRKAKKIDKPLSFFIHSIDYQLIAKAINTKSFIRDFIHLTGKNIFLNLYKKCDIIMSPSNNVREMLEINELDTKIKDVKIGIDHQKFKPVKDKKRAKEKIGIDPENKVIGYVGRLSNEKDIKTLIEAFKRVKLEEECKLLIVGKGIKSYEKIIENNKDIIHIKETSEVVKYLQAMDIFVMPSHLETTSIATLEAMSCSLPPICTKVGNMKFYVEEKQNGLFFPKGNPQVLSLKLKWLLREDYVRKTLGNNARKTILKNFDWKDTENKVINILQDYKKWKEKEY